MECLIPPLLCYCTSAHEHLLGDILPYQLYFTPSVSTIKATPRATYLRGRRRLLHTYLAMSDMETSSPNDGTN